MTMNIDEIIQADIKSSLTKSGTLLFIAGFLLFMGIITCEILYKAPYNTRDSYISELATETAGTHVIQQPAAKIFNSVMIAAGLMIMLAGYLVQRVFKKYYCTIPIGLLGLGFLGVGIFPGYVVPWHLVFALIIFFSGGISAIVSFRLVKSPLRYIFIVLGLITLVLLFTNKFASRHLGVGGSERWIFYPIVFWITGMGTYLLGIKDGHKNTL